MKLNRNGYDDDLYANPINFNSDNTSEENKNSEVSKMRKQPISSGRYRAGGAQTNGRGKSVQSGIGSLKAGKKATGKKGGSLGQGGGNIVGKSSGGSYKSPDKGGKYNITKSFLNKFKFKLQKDTKEEEKAEAEANKCDPCNEFKAGNGLDLGCVDWGKCAFAKPCCKKFPQPCGCFAYLCMGVTFVGGLVSSIILF